MKNLPRAARRGLLALILTTACSDLPTESDGTAFARRFDVTIGSVTDLGTLAGGSFSRANAINESGLIVGTSEATGGVLRAFLYNGSMQSLGVLSGGSNSTAWAINDNGTVAGESEPGPAPFKWSSIAGMQSLYFSGAGRAYGINNSDVIVGTEVAFNPNNGFATWPGTTRQFLSNGGQAGANAINNAGQIAGWGFAGYNQLPAAILWASSIAGANAIGTIDWSSGNPNVAFISYGLGINNHGHVVGYELNSAGNAQPFVWTSSTGLEHLSTLGGDRGTAYGINDEGVIVGESRNTGGQDRPTVWTPNGDGTYTAQDLGTLGGTTGAARGLNEQGQIVGWSYNASGVQRATLWTLVTPAPQMPSGLDREWLDGDIVLAWTDNSTNETRFEVERSTYDEGGAEWGAWQPIASPAAGVTTYTDETVADGNRYQYRVAACNSVGCSEWLESTVVVTSPQPSAPASLAVTIISDTQIDLAWSDVATTENRYVILRRTWDGTTRSWGVLANIAELPANSTSYSDNTAGADNAYAYQVRACIYERCSAAAGSERVQSAVRPTTPPTLAIVTDPVTPLLNVLSWSGGSSGATSVRIRSRTFDPATAKFGAWSDFASASASMTSMPLLLINAMTDFQARLCNVAGCSDYSSAVRYAELAPAAPGSVLAAVGPSSTVSLNWVHVSSTETLMRIMRRERDPVTGVWSAYTLLTNVAAGTPFHMDTTTVAGRTYQYAIRACGPFGCSTLATGSRIAL